MDNDRLIRKMDNETWRKYLEEAPSDKCRQYIQCQFYYSLLGNKGAKFVVADMDKIEAEMGLEDWKYLYKCAVDTPFKAICKKKIEEFSMG